MIWKSHCPKKVNLFNWLTQNNNILTLDKLVARRYNSLLMTICVLCQSSNQTMNNLLIFYLITMQIWHFFTHAFSLPVPLTSFQDLWIRWRPYLLSQVRVAEDIIIRAITWNMQLERNESIFNDEYSVITNVNFKCIYILISWIDA